MLTPWSPADSMKGARAPLNDISRQALRLSQRYHLQDSEAEALAYQYGVLEPSSVVRRIAAKLAEIRRNAVNPNQPAQPEYRKCVAPAFDCRADQQRRWYQLGRLFSTIYTPKKLNREPKRYINIRLGRGEEEAFETSRLANWLRYCTGDMRALSQWHSARVVQVLLLLPKEQLRIMITLMMTYDWPPSFSLTLLRRTHSSLVSLYRWIRVRRKMASGDRLYQKQAVVMADLLKGSETVVSTMVSDPFSQEAVNCMFRSPWNQRLFRGPPDFSDKLSVITSLSNTTPEQYYTAKEPDMWDPPETKKKGPPISRTYGQSRAGRPRLDRTGCQCLLCSLSKTPQWRFVDIYGDGYMDLVCNACYMRYKGRSILMLDPQMASRLDGVKPPRPSRPEEFNASKYPHLMKRDGYKRRR
ncbi:MAG: uncharacterized protein KVP18_004534 [Porospora cf. gigantea A]|uniref:uncharacterized protein n=1 Tax=Porospora cf. gigantea A TaxID=2853593 RepID=UPI00355940AB|nr:MAG: hypothetical protein KVP18_004534 [Porospora cf. gigantea A]